MNDKLIKIGDKTYKEAQVIMLPKKDKDYPSNISQIGEHQHLYIVSNEGGKTGDWCFEKYKEYESDLIRFLDKDSKYSWFLRQMNMNWESNDPKCIRIIAATDSSLLIPLEFERNSASGFTQKPLPKPSNDFIKKFVELNGDIKDVFVEYVHTKTWLDIVLGEEDILSIKWFPKIAPDNTISIIKKEFWKDTIKTMSEKNIILQELQNIHILDSFIAEIKKEFSDQNWDYLEFIKERVLKNNK